MKNITNEKNKYCWLVDCPCDTCEYVNNEDYRHKICDFAKTMKYMMDLAHIPNDKRHIIKLRPDTENDAQQYEKLNHLKSNILDIVNEGENVLICSSTTGNGKTSWALKIMLHYLDLLFHKNLYTIIDVVESEMNGGIENDENRPAVFVNTNTYLLKQKDFTNPMSIHERNAILNADLVIWDDVGLYKLSDFDLAHLYAIIDDRINNGRSNIFTSNRDSVEDLEKIVGPMLASRVWGSFVFKLDGQDKRKTKEYII